MGPLSPEPVVQHLRGDRDLGVRGRRGHGRRAGLLREVRLLRAVVRLRLRLRRALLVVVRGRRPRRGVLRDGRGPAVRGEGAGDVLWLVLWRGGTR